MSSYKKAFFVFIFLSLFAQQTVCMKKMGTFFKNIKTKNFNFFNTYKFMPTINHASLWQKGGLATLVGTVGYAAWNSNQSAAILQEKEYKQHDAKTREQRIEEYVKNYETYLTRDNFCKASPEEQLIMVEAVMICLKDGVCNKELEKLASYEGSKEQQIMLTLAALEGMRKASKVGDFASILFSNYKKLNTEQRDKVIDAVIFVLRQGKRVWSLEHLYSNSTAEEREKWCDGLIEVAQQKMWADVKGNWIHQSIGAVYKTSTAAERDKFLNFFKSTLEDGDPLKLLESFDIYWIYKASTEEEQNKLFAGMMAALKNDYIRTCWKSDDGCTKIIITPAMRLESKKPLFDSKIYSGLRAKHKEEMLDYIIDVSIIKNNKKNITINKTLKDMYYWMPHEGKIKLAQQLINASFSGKSIDFGSFFSYVQADEKNEIVEYFFEKTKESSAVDFGKHRWLDDACEKLTDKQLKKMKSIVIEIIKKQGDKVKGLRFLSLHDKILSGSHDDSFCRDVVKLIQEGYVLHKDDVEWLYKYWSRYDRSESDKIRDTFVTQIKKGNIKYLQYFYCDKNSLLFEDLSDHDKETIKKSVYPYFNWDILKGTQTGGHLEQNYFNVFATYLQYLETDNKQDLLGLLERAIHAERDLIGKKYVVFYHAQMWNISFKLFLYDLIAQAKYQSSSHYLDTRFTQDGTCEENARKIFDSKELHKRLLKGRKNHDDRLPLVFANMALAGNTTNWGSCTLGFLVRDTNITEFTIDNCAIFAYFGFEEFCKKNKSKLDELEKQFNALSQHGNLLQIAVPEDIANKYVYAAIPGGYPTEYDLKSNLPRIFSYVLGFGTTSSIKKIAQLLKKSPESFKDSDRMEFVFPMTPYGMAKGRRDGIQIKSFNTADPEKLQNIVTQLQDILQPLAEEWKVKRQLDPFACYKQHKKKFRNL